MQRDVTARSIEISMIFWVRFVKMNYWAGRTEPIPRTRPAIIKSVFRLWPLLANTAALIDEVGVPLRRWRGIRDGSLIAYLSSVF
jgi:hypothetical protein